ncbi:MAG: peptidoglycan editing factor PgeF [Patescibacteria group bacterium]
MLKQTSAGIWQSDLLLSVTGLVHGYSSRRLGDMRKNENRETFLNFLRLNLSSLVFSEQIHANKIHIVTDRDLEKKVFGTDGLVYKKNNGMSGLAVRVADCVPILAVDPDASVIGVAHAGWKGTLGSIATRLIDTMKSVGADTERILVSVGPHIGMCCYSVPEERAGQFVKMFNSDPRIMSHIEGAPHLDLGYANVQQLLEAGISADHIDVAITCTSCQVDTFFSYRKDTGETFGEILGVIGYAH